MLPTCYCCGTIHRSIFILTIHEGLIMSLDIHGNLLSRKEMEIKILEQEKQIAELDTAVEGLSMLNAQILARVRDLEKESTLDTAELLARIIKLEKMMGDGK